VLGDLHRLIDHGGGRDVTLQQLERADAQDVAVDDRHALGGPPDRVGADEPVELVPTLHNRLDEIAAERIGVLTIVEEFDRGTRADVRSVENLDGGETSRVTRTHERVCALSGAEQSERPLLRIESL
jgi:hypothetical protein